MFCCSNFKFSIPANSRKKVLVVLYSFMVLSLHDMGIWIIFDFWRKHGISICLQRTTLHMFNYIKLFSLQYQAVSIRTQEEHFSTITGTISKEQIQEKVLAVCKAFDKINAEKVHVLIDWFFLWSVLWVFADCSRPGWCVWIWLKTSSHYRKHWGENPPGA